MPFTKGKSGNPNGRSKKLEDARLALNSKIADFLLLKFKNIIYDFDGLELRDRVRVFCELYRHALAKRDPLSKDVPNIEQLSDADLIKVVNVISNGINPNQYETIPAN